ncbi:MAG: ABC transporter substrate-binding protein [Betaproteobacteria bacterium]|nr:ABC transporter substrate-binding protein [Betaproteobacteria bacterium]
MVHPAAIAALLLAAAAAVAPCAAQGPTAGTLRVAMPVAENGFDPQAVYDAYSSRICDAIFDALYTYDYFARPAKLVPNTADGLPQIADGGRTYTLKVRRGIFFAPHPAFGGKPRELTAEDYVYSFKRILDPAVRSYSLHLLEGRLAGLDPVLAQARKAGKLDYAAPIEGLKALDRHTLQVKFIEPNYSFQHVLATTAFAAVAKEVVAAKGDSAGRVMEDPVGTGPYRLAEWRRSQRIVLEANPSFRDVRFPAPPAGEPGDAAIAKGLAGRRLPLTPRIEVSIIEEAQPRLLAFRRGELDYVDVPSSLAETVLDGDKLKPDLAATGVRLLRQVDPSLAFTFFNMEDPVVGGYTPEKIALRRAITMANDRGSAVRILQNGQAMLATQMIPPPVPGHSDALAMKDPFDPAGARALLDRFGYKDRDGDGFRELPDGRPLVLKKGMTPTAADRAASELWTKNLAAIGIRTEFVVQKWPELNKMAEAGQLQVWNLAWIASIPDVDAFYSPLFSPNVGTSNDARLKLADYDRAYERMRALPDGPERRALYKRMNELVAAYAPWILETYSYQNRLAQPWLKGVKLHPFRGAPWAYYEAAR